MSYANTSLLLPLSGANNGTEFPDWSPVPKSISRVGVITKTDQFKYYDSSAFFDGTDDYLSFPHAGSPALGANDFCLEGWFRLAALPASGVQWGVFSKYQSSGGNNEWFAGFWNDSGTHRLRYGWTTDGTTLNAINAAHSISTTIWAHIAWVRNGDVLTIYQDGTSIGSDTITGSIYAGAYEYRIGRFGAIAATFFSGHMADLRVTVGSPVYTANFTPPARLIGTISNAAVGTPKILDAAGNPAERTVIAVPRSAPVRMWSTVSNASGEFEIQAPAGVDHSVVALADEATLYNDIVHRVIPV